MSTLTLSTEVGTVVNEEVYQRYFRDKFNRLMKKGKPFSANDFVGGKVPWEPNLVGATWLRFLTKNRKKIKVVGKTASKNPRSNGSLINVYQAA